MEKQRIRFSYLFYSVINKLKLKLKQIQIHNEILNILKRKLKTSGFLIF